MLSSITPLGERGRQRRWTTTAVAYAIGSVAGGAAMGAVFGGLGSIFGSLVTPGAGWILVVALALAALIEIGWLPVELPKYRRQVNEDWLDEYRGWVVGVGFGFQLGAAFFVMVTSASVYVTFLAALLTGSVTGGVVIGAGFGAARAVPLLAVRKVTTPNRLAAVHRRLDALSGAAHVAVAIGTGVLAVIALGVA